MKRWTSTSLETPRHALVAIALVLLTACSPRTMLVRGVADEIAAQTSAEEEDLVLAREAGAFYLKLAESLLREQPAHLPLAASVTSGFTQYAYAFVAFEADRAASRNARAAAALRERAQRLYWRGQRHGMAALEAHRPGFRAQLSDPDPTRWPRLDAESVPVAYWAAAAWGGAISLGKDRPEVVADLPLAHRLARLAYERDPRHADGALASLMGSFEAARPGGSTREAARYFDEAIAVGQGRQAGPLVAKAEGLALPGADRAGFEALLRQAIAAAQARPDLSNAVMRERAEWLLVIADDLF